MTRVLRAPLSPLRLPIPFWRPAVLLAALLGLSAVSAFAQGGPPVITSLSPNFALAGGSSFALQVTVTTTITATSITFNGTAVCGTLIPCTGGGPTWTATVPGSLLTTPGIVPVTISSAFGTSSPANFAIVGTPSITGFSPPTRTQGNTTLPLNILGTNFLPGDTVIWDAITFTPVNILPGDITINLSAAAVTTGLHNVTVQHARVLGFGLSNTAQINVNAAPVLNFLSQSSSTFTGAAFTLGLNGSNFVAGMKILLYDSSTQSSSSFTPTTTSANLLTLALPAGFFTAPSNTLSFSAITPDGVQTASLPYTVFAPPTISSLSPNTLTAGSPQFTLTVNGVFPTGVTVQWNGSNRVTPSVTNGQALATIPASDVQSPGTANVRVITSDQVASSTLPFTITKLNSNGTLNINPPEPRPAVTAVPCATSASPSARGISRSARQWRHWPAV